MTFDLKVPAQLKKTQIWFGGIIGRPFDENSKINPISPAGQPMELEAALHIRPSPTMEPVARIQIYNQQYWWRLLNALQETFPLLTRLFGYHDFNQTIAIPYLYKYPPDHWSLGVLGDKLAKWVEEDYHATDKPLIYDAAAIDYAFTKSFTAYQNKRLGKDLLPEQSLENLLSESLYLQDSIHLFEMNYDLFEFRTVFLKNDPEYWIDNDFPPLKKEKRYHFVLYQNHNRDISVREVSAEEYQLLNLFKTGSTVDSACEWLEQQNNDVYREAMKNLHLWFQNWVMLNWLTL